MSKADNILEAKAIAARALLRDRVGLLAPSANDEAMRQATHDAEIAIDAPLRSGLLAGVPNERVIASSGN